MITYGYRIYDGMDGKLHFDQIVAGRVYPLQPKQQDALLPRGYYGPDFTFLGDEGINDAVDETRDIDWRDDWEEAQHPRGQPENKGEFAKVSGGGSASGKFGKSYVRAGEAGETTPEAEHERGQQAIKAAHKIAGKVFHFGKETLGAEDYEIVHHHFRNAKTQAKDNGKVGHYLRSMAKGAGHLAKAHLEEEKKHAVHAVQALKVLATGKLPNAQQAKGLFSYGARALLIAGGMALGDPTGTVGALASTLAEDVVHHVMLEHAVKLFVGGGYGLIKGAVAKPQTDAAPGDPDQQPDGDNDGDNADDLTGEMSDEDREILQRFLECLASTVETMTEADAMRIIAQGQTPDDDGEDGDDEPGNGHDDEQSAKPSDDDDVDYPQTQDVDWREELHPREPEGAAQSAGGEFTKGAGASAARMAEIRGKKTEAKGGAAERQAAKAEAKAAAKEAKAASFREPTIPRSKDEPYAVSTRLPSEPQQEKTKVNPHQTAALLVDYASTYHPEVQEWVKKTSDLLVGNTLYNRGLDKDKKKKPPLPYVGMPPGPDGETPREATERFINFAKDNILSIYHAVPTSWRHRASLWYDGANVVAHKWAKDYDKTPAQIAGVIAAQSPKKDWFQNVEVAARILKYNSKSMRGTEFNAAAAERLDEFIAARKKEKDRLLYTALRNKLCKADGSWMKLGELSDPIERAAFISMYDQANTDLHYKELSPEGKYGDFVRNKDVEPEEGEDPDEETGKRGKKAKPGKMGDPTVLVWPVMENIAKGLRILDDGSVENISANLGDAHKVRNFYMNIMYPMSKGGHITADTHAIAGAFMRPLGQNDPEVLVGLGNSSPANKTHGLGGTYPIIAEAYRRAAAEASKEGEELLPRQMQSIVWEGLRGLFSPEAKRDKQLRNKVDAVWKQHMDDASKPDTDKTKMTADRARKAIMRIANPETGAPRTPKWYARTA